MLYRALESTARKYPDKLAVVGPHRKYTFSELLQQVRSVALYLQKQGFGPGDHLVMGIPPSPEFYLVFFAAAALGMTTIPAPPSGKLPSAVRPFEPLLLAGSEEFISNVLASGIGCKHKILWEAKRGLAISPPKGRFLRKKFFKQRPVLGTFSSGTTGEPVIFERTAQYLFQRAHLGAAAWRITPDDTLLATGPFTSGLNTTNHLVLPMVQGTKVVVLENFHRRQVVDAIARERVTVLFVVPMVFDVLARLPAGYDADFSSLRCCIAGGTHLPKEIAERVYRRFGLRIAQGYGGAHFTPAFTVNLDGVPGSVGRADGLFPVKIVNDHGKAVAPSGVGEIVFDLGKLKIAWAMAVLQKNPNRKGGFVFTGDLGRLDDDGNLYIVGRKALLIKVGANRVAPAEVEDALRTHPHVQDAIVFAVRPGQTDEAVGAVVVPARPVTAGELIAHCARRLDPYKCPQTISFRKSLPRNAHGKVIRRLPRRSTGG